VNGFLLHMGSFESISNSKCYVVKVMNFLIGRHNTIHDLLGSTCEIQSVDIKFGRETGA